MLIELAVLAGCYDSRDTNPARGRGAASHAALVRAVAPRQSGHFVCSDKICRQSQPRLPDAAEWSCAERDGVAWCAGGEAAAGVVPGAPNPSFRCGARWGNSSERVCVDRSPEYPERSGSFRCWFEQEQGIARVCEKLATPGARAAAPPASSIPACWLDRDCPLGRCDRGACACASDRDCTAGRCSAGICVEARL